MLCTESSLEDKLNSRLGDDEESKGEAEAEVESLDRLEVIQAVRPNKTRKATTNDVYFVLFNPRNEWHY